MILSIILIILPFLIFFIVQVAVNREIPLAMIVLAFIGFALYQSTNILGESLLLMIGLLLGIIIEVGLGLVLRTQHWENASFLGVPYWLPLIWGYGFVTIHRLGEIVLWWVY